MKLHRCISSACVGLALVTSSGCFDWRYHVEESGVEFRRLRTVDGTRIGELAHDTSIAGRPCRQGWVHLHANGVPAAFSAASDLALPRFTIPAGTWVLQDEHGTVTVCAFPRDTRIQGFLCRGTGGPKGVQTSFHASGALKQFYPPENIVIAGVPCAAGLVRGTIELHENGRLNSVRLSRDWSHHGRSFPRGTRLRFDADGALRPD